MAIAASSIVGRDFGAELVMTTPASYRRVLFLRAGFIALLGAAATCSFGGTTTHSEPYRLRMVETLLHSPRATVVALGADLYVISSKNFRH